jgi:uncharacterized membrane protein YkoI
MKFLNRVVPALAAGLLLSAGPALADDDQRKAKRLHDAGTILPLEAILQKSAELYPGSRVIETDFDDDDDDFNRYVYEVEIVDAKGVVWEIEFDAKTGEVLKREQDD